MANYGYLRMSTNRQDGEGQRNMIAGYATENGLQIPAGNWIAETVGGRVDWEERELGRVFREVLKKGDTLIIAELSRFTRLGHQATVEILARMKRLGVSLHFVNGEQDGEPTVYDGSPRSLENEIRLLFRCKGYEDAVADLSRRTKAALAARKAKGVKLGRPKGVKLTEEQKMELSRYLELGLNKSSIAKLLGFSRAKVYRVLEEQKKGR